MRNEIYFQYTTGWQQIDIRKENHGRLYSMIRWCEKHDSGGAFHVITETNTRRDINNRMKLVYIIKSIRFKSKEDAMMFALEWTA